MRILETLGAKLDHRFGWDHLPLPVALLALIGIRETLRDQNLYDTGRGPKDVPPVDDHPRLPDGAHARRHLQRPRRPAHGESREPLRPQRPDRPHVARAAGQAARAEPASDQPRAAHARRVHPGHDAQPAGRCVDPVRGARLVQPRQERSGRTRGRSSSRRTIRGPSTRCRSSARGRTRAAMPGKPPTFVTDDTHWWDASQIYGRDPAFADALRAGEYGKLKIDDARPAAGRRRGSTSTSPASPATSGSGSRCCTRCSCASTTRSATTCTSAYPEMTDQQLYDRARLVVAALMAKIHTVDWTPAIIAHPTTVKALRTNWWGLEGEKLDKSLGREDVERGPARHPGLAHGPPRRAVLADRGVRRRLPHAPADPGRLQVPLADRRPRAQEPDAARAGAPRTCASGWRRCRRATCSTRSARRTRARSRCTTSRSTSRTSTGPTARRSTSPRSTSCARASGACRATTSSGGCSTCRRRRRSRS